MQQVDIDYGFCEQDEEYLMDSFIESLWQVDNDYQYRQALNERGVECPHCKGRGGLGTSMCGVTLSWRECNWCEGYGAVLMDRFSMKDKVTLLTGKYKGKVGEVCCYTRKHQLSDKNRLQVSVQTGLGYKTLLMNEDNIELVK